MTKKPTYEELEKRVKELKKEAIRLKQIEEALLQSEERYRTIFESTGTAIITGDESTTILMVNSEFEKLSGYSKDEIQGKKSWTDFVGKEDLEKIKEYHRLRRIDHSAAPRNHEFRFINRQGKIRYIFATVAMIPGTKIGISSFSDITERKLMEEEREKLIEKIKKLSITDPLTGSYNRGCLIERLPHETKRSRRYGYPLSLVLCDIDHFKKVNDTYGHQVGDQVLKEFVRCVNETIRDGVDWVARYGGEEFIVVSPDTELKDTQIMAERLRDVISQRVIRSQEKEICITASFGVTGFNRMTPDKKISPENIINQADRYLYQAKQEGRNRVVVGKL